MARAEVRRTFILCLSFHPPGTFVLACLATSQDAAERAKDAKVKAAARASEARKRAATATAAAAAAAASAASAGGGQKAHCREPTQANTSPDEVTSR